MKHGLNTEVHAKAKSKQIFKKLCKICVFKNPGMKIWEGFPLIYVILTLEIAVNVMVKIYLK